MAPVGFGSLNDLAGAADQVPARPPRVARALWQLNRDGLVREMYSPGRPGAVLPLETAARQDAEAALAGLPLAAGGVIDFELTELRPFIAFEVLFADRPDS